MFLKGKWGERKGHAVVTLIDVQGVTLNFNVYSRDAYRLNNIQGVGAVILSSFTLSKPERSILKLLCCLI